MKDVIIGLVLFAAIFGIMYLICHFALGGVVNLLEWLDGGYEPPTPKSTKSSKRLTRRNVRNQTKQSLQDMNARAMAAERAMLDEAMKWL